MAFQPVPDTFALHLRARLHGQRVENTLYFKSLVPLSQEDLQEVVDTVSDYIAQPGILGTWSTSLIWTEIYAVDLSSPISFQAVNNDLGGTAGTNATAEPGNVTVAVAFKSGLTGRSSRGRIYWMGIPNTWVAGNGINTTGQASVVDTTTAVIAQVTALGYTHVVVSRQQAGVILATGLTYPIVNVGLTDTALDSQRRRLAGRGD